MNDSSMFLKLWEQNKELFCKLIKIPSMYDETTISKDTPYGKPIRDALEYMKSLCDESGLYTEMYNNEVLTASWGSEGNTTSTESDSRERDVTEYAAAEDDACNREIFCRQKQRIDIVSHLDVVGIEGEWDYSPFSGLIRDGFIYGRGTQDMKSGAFLSLLALKILKEEMEEKGITPKREIRLVFGSDEERTMEEMKRYVKIAGKPAFAFTPDGQFPMAIGEKGALMWEMSGNIGDTSISMTGGVQPNVIAPFAEAVIKKANFGQMPDTSEKENSGKENQENKDSRILEDIHLVESGIAAHASRPEQGDSAIVKMLRTLTQKTGNEMLSRLYQFFSDPYGVGAGMGYNLEPMGKLTLNPGIMKIQDGKLFAQIDCRYPYGVTSEELTRIFQEAFPELEICLPYDDPPTLVLEEDEYVQILKEAYQESTGKPCEPYISGGVSYSKVFSHCVAFGCVAKDSINTAHQKDEKIAEKDMVEALEIYYRAFKKLINAAEREV